MLLQNDTPVCFFRSFDFKLLAQDSQWVVDHLVLWHLNSENHYHRVFITPSSSLPLIKESQMKTFIFSQYYLPSITTNCNCTISVLCAFSVKFEHCRKSICIVICLLQIFLTVVFFFSYFYPQQCGMTIMEWYKHVSCIIKDEGDLA